MMSIFVTLNFRICCRYFWLVELIFGWRGGDLLSPTYVPQLPGEIQERRPVSSQLDLLHWWPIWNETGPCEALCGWRTNLMFHVQIKLCLHVSLCHVWTRWFEPHSTVKALTVNLIISQTCKQWTFGNWTGRRIVQCFFNQFIGSVTFSPLWCFKQKALVVRESLSRPKQGQQLISGVGLLICE